MATSWSVAIVVAFFAVLAFYLVGRRERRKVEAEAAHQYQESEQLLTPRPELAKSVDEGVDLDDSEFDIESAASKAGVSKATAKEIANLALLTVLGDRKLGIAGLVPSFMKSVQDTLGKLPHSTKLSGGDEITGQLAVEFCGFLAYNLALCMETRPELHVEVQAWLASEIVDAIAVETESDAATVSARFREYWVATDVDVVLKAFSWHVGEPFGITNYAVASLLAAKFASSFPGMANAVLSEVFKPKGR